MANIARISRSAVGRRLFCSGASAQGGQPQPQVSLWKQTKDYARWFVKRPTTPGGDLCFSLVTGGVLTFGSFGILAGIADAYLDMKYGKYEPSFDKIYIGEGEGTGKCGTLFLAYRTLGVDFGGLVTSPLYVYLSMQLKYPTEENYLGIFSIMFWTLSLIGVVKYAGIALRADDQGQGGTFALYSLPCRNINIDILSSKNQQANSSSATRLSRLGKFLESLIARRVLLFIAILDMCMLIGDGVLTPAISVLSAMEGIRAPFPSFNRSMVELVSVIILIALFVLQKYGTSRVSFLFSPIMGAWTLTTTIVGIHKIIKHYPSIYKAVSPYYIFTFFWRNGKEGWLLLSGTILCITGSEAMFADLGHFDAASIQIAFFFTIYPSLILTYAGRTAYLIRNPNDHADGFYKFIPSAVYWPMFVIATLAAIVASQSLISATFSITKQYVALGYFPRVKIVHTSNKQEGEVYAPEVNYILMVICVAAILIFGDGADIGNAFGEIY